MQILRKIIFVFFKAAWLFLLLADISYAADPKRGGELYATHCMVCHGASGIGVMPNTPNFAQNEALMQPDSSLLVSISSGKGIMPAYQGILTDQDILDVIVFLRTLN